MKKYLRFRYHIICFLLSMLIFVFLAILALFVERSIKLFLLILGIVPGTIIFYSICLFYLVFQFVYFDTEGIHILLLKKELKLIKWNEIENIQETYKYRSPVYCLKLKNGKEVILDRRKKIKEELDKYYKEN